MIELSAIEKLQRTLRGALHRYGTIRSKKLRMAASEYAQLVEEVADETICLGRARITSYDPERGPLGHWLFMLGRRILSRELDRWQAFSAFEKEHVVAESLHQDFGRGGTRALAGVLDRDQLAQALTGLCFEQRQVLALFYLAQLSLEETGAILNKTPEAVSSLLCRARKNARDRLEGVPPGRRGRPRKGDAHRAAHTRL